MTRYATLGVVTLILALGTLKCNSSENAIDYDGTQYLNDSDSSSKTVGAPPVTNDSDTVQNQFGYDFVTDHWEWTSRELPLEGFPYYQQFDIWTAPEGNQIFICMNGGESYFDSTMVYNLETDSFSTIESVYGTRAYCNSVRGVDDEHVWMIAAIYDEDPVFRSGIFRYQDHAWVEESVEEIAGCSRPLINGIFGASSESLELVVQCDAQYLSLSYTGAEWVSPTVSTLISQLEAGCISVDGVQTTDPDGEVQVLAPNLEPGLVDDSGLCLNDNAMSDMNIQPQNVLQAAVAANGTDLDVITSRGMYSGTQSGWEQVFSCPYNLGPPINHLDCWHTTAKGNLPSEWYLGGGIGANGYSPADSWRLNRYYNNTLYEILLPCEGEEPKCSLFNLVSNDEFLFAVIKSTDTLSVSLIYAPLPQN